MGLYTVAARSSGLAEGDPTRLTVAGRDLVDRMYLPIFAKEGLRNADAVVARLAKPRTELDLEKTDGRFVEAIAKVLAKRLSSAERETYRTHLLFGGPQDKTVGGQPVLARAMESTFDDEEWTLSPARVRHLAKRCCAAGDIGIAVADRLERIRTAELLIAPAAALFGVMLASDGQTISELSRVVRRQWGASVRTVDVDATVSLETELRDATGDADTGRRWVKLARTLAAGEFNDTLALLMEQNAFVMKARAGAGPWVDLNNGRLRVRFRDENVGDLPDKSELPAFWRHSYFHDSLRTVALALQP